MGNVKQIEGKPLSELSLKPGDVVCDVTGHYGGLNLKVVPRGEVRFFKNHVCMYNETLGSGLFCDIDGLWIVVSRASASGQPAQTDDTAVDLTAIEKPLGLLDERTRAALKAFGGEIQIYMGHGWVDCKHAGKMWCAYRAKPQPEAMVKNDD